MSLTITDTRRSVRDGDLALVIDRIDVLFEIGFRLDAPRELLLEIRSCKGLVEEIRKISKVIPSGEPQCP